MKDFIKNSIKSILTLLINGAICHYLYLFNHLDQIFGHKITFEQWLAIFVIVQVLTHKTTYSSSNKKENDN